MINRLGDSPQHLKIAEYLIQQIQAEGIKVNERIPSENELCRQFETNRQVVRQAITRITNLGWVSPVQGKGYFVNSIPKPIQYAITEQTRFSDNMEKVGVDYKSKLLSWTKEYPSENEKENLGISYQDFIYRLEILRYVDDLPISITTTALLEKEVPGIEKYFDRFTSLYQILLENYHFRPNRSRSIFQASLPCLSDIEHLDIPESVPIIQIESLMNHPNGTPIEFSVARIRGDRQKCLVIF
ncbi:GntR family transcriptional regulator [Bacillus sp. PS06]|uniref:GntR family transcriptional regulator n=1 Tax=Bacillus sp. PS06 TaxID=2764176 RepID=UPI001781E91C|nr:GntR family transcriptional regulator [Bacillus sp. PS06]MBD8067911.1 GntR family transcriptional regulator [Bacillus sp. PS06]